MNTELLYSQSSVTVGQRLRQARENMGLSQEKVADHLCLKISIVQDIEDDHTRSDLYPTFLRGYIRSYARLVHLSEDELLPVKAQHVSIRTSKVAAMQGFPLERIHTRRSPSLEGVFWLVIFVIMSLTSAWWWQNYETHRQDSLNLSSTSYAQFDWGKNSTSIPSNKEVGNINFKTSVISPLVVQNKNEKITYANNSQLNESLLTVVFTGDCWLEIFDATNKQLFFGLRHKGDTIKLFGLAPYKIKIGAPYALEMQYQGKQVDLSEIKNKKQVVRIILPYFMGRK